MRIFKESLKLVSVLPHNLGKYFLCSKDFKCVVISMHYTRLHKYPPTLSGGKFFRPLQLFLMMNAMHIDMARIQEKHFLHALIDTHRQE